MILYLHLSFLLFQLLILLPTCLQCDLLSSANTSVFHQSLRSDSRWHVSSIAGSSFGRDTSRSMSRWSSIDNSVLSKNDMETNQQSKQTKDSNKVFRKSSVNWIPKKAPVKRIASKPSLSHIHAPHFSMVPDEHIPRRPPLRASYSVEGTFLWTVGLFGTVGNGAIVLTGILSKRFRRPLHILVTTLATTDLFISVIYIPSYTYFLLEGTRPLMYDDQEVVVGDRVYKRSMMDSSFCTVGHAIFVEIASVTLTLKSLISLYLYVCSVSKSKARIYFSRRNTIVFIIFAWILNFLILFLPSFIGYSKVDFYPSTFQCMFTSQDFVYIYRLKEFEHNRMLFTFLALVFHLLELLVICICFVNVHKAITRGRSQWGNSQDQKHLEALSNYSRALKTMCLVFVSFFICWMPIYVINIIDPFHSKLPSDLHHIAMDLLLLKSAINPSIYIYGIRSLRHEMKVLCLCQCNGNARRGEKIIQPSTSFIGALGSGSTGCAAV